MRDGPTRTCVLCGQKPRGSFVETDAAYLLCEKHYQTWLYAAEDDIKDYVRRVRKEQCKYSSAYPCAPVESFVLGFRDCYGCGAYAPREKYDCHQCIHETIKNECQSRLKGIDCIVGNQFVPRSCGNCNRQEDCKTAKTELSCSNLSAWQPRPVKPTCGACKDWKRNTQGSLDYGECLKYHADAIWENQVYSECFVPRVVKKCGDCGFWTETRPLSSDCRYGKCGYKYGYTYNCREDAPPHYDGCFQPRAAESPHEYHSDAADALEYALTGVKNTQEKSCSRCGHFHAEPYEPYQWCDAIHPPAPYTMGKDFDPTIECPCIKFQYGDKFTPRAAPQPEKTCNNCRRFSISKGDCNGCEKYSRWLEQITNFEECVHYNDSHCDAKGNCWCSGGTPVSICEFERKPAPACARCNASIPSIINTVYIHTNPRREVPLCNQCLKEGHQIDTKTNTWEEWYDHETAAGRPWVIDQPKEAVIKITKSPTNYVQFKIKLCAFGKEWTEDCKGKLCITCNKPRIKEAPVTPQSTTVNLAGNKITIGGKHYSPEELAQVKELIEKGDYIVLPNNEDVKIMFKCQSCGYHDETRKKVKYCPICGVEVEKMDKKVPVEKICKTCYYNWDKIGNFQSCRPIVGVCVNYNKWAPMDGAAVEQQEADWKGLLKDSQAERVRMARNFEVLEKENAALAQKVSQLEKDLAEWEIEDDENYGEQMKTEKENEHLKEEIAHLRQKGIPFKCRRCKYDCKLDSEGKRNVAHTTSCPAFKPHPAKPASLGKLRRQAEKRQKQQLKDFEAMEKAIRRTLNYKGHDFTVGKFHVWEEEYTVPDSKYPRRTWRFAYDGRWLAEVKDQAWNVNDWAEITRILPEFWQSLKEHYQNQLAGANQ